MPRGRPPKPGTESEKAEIRREQIRLNVIAYRQRKKARTVSQKKADKKGEAAGDNADAGSNDQDSAASPDDASLVADSASQSSQPQDLGDFVGLPVPPLQSSSAPDWPSAQYNQNDPGMPTILDTAVNGFPEFFEPHPPQKQAWMNSIRGPERLQCFGGPAKFDWYQALDGIQTKLVHALQDQTSQPLADLSFETFLSILHGCGPLLSQTHIGLYAPASAELVSADRLIDIAVLACSANALGVVARAPPMLELGQQAYYHAVTLLKARLSQPVIQDPVLVTAAAEALMLHDALGTKDEYASMWGNNLSGALGVMMDAGPLAFKSELGVQVLRCFRRWNLSHSVIHRNPNIFNDSAWRTLPFHGIVKTPQDELFEIGEKLPILLERYDLTVKPYLSSQLDSRSISTFSIFLQSLVLLLRDLQSWSQRYIDTDREITFRPISETFLHQLPNNAFPISVRFASNDIMELMMEYWTARLQVLVLIVDLSAVLPQPLNPLPCPLPSEADALETASLLCQAQDTAFEGEADVRGPGTCAVGPLWAALQNFMFDMGKHAQQIEWCMAVGCMGAERGIAVSRLLYRRWTGPGPRAPWEHLLGRQS